MVGIGTESLDINGTGLDENSRLSSSGEAFFFLSEVGAGVEMEQHLLLGHKEFGLVFYFVFLVVLCLLLFGYGRLGFGFVVLFLFSYHQTLEIIYCNWLEIRTAMSLCLTVFCSFIGLSIVLCTQWINLW